MKLSARFISALLSCAVAGSGLVPAAFSSAAENTQDTSAPIVYDTTESAESKDSAAASATTTAAAQTTTAAASETKAETTTTAAQAKEAETTTTEVPYNVFDIYNAHQIAVVPVEYDLNRESYGIDVSQWQADIDWSAVKNSGVEFAIIRAGYGKFVEQEDPKFDINMQNAQAVGIDCGTYWYSYATSVDAAYEEAMACYEVIKDYDFQYPVFFDIEDPCQSRLSAAECSAIVETFCHTLQQRGYYVGVYSYANFLTTHIFQEVLDKYDVWVANFDVPKPAYDREYTMWQYTSSGYVSGISGRVDMDHCYINYPLIISPDSYVAPQTTAPDTATTSETTTTTTTAPAYLKHGVDVSEWSGDIDWSAVKGVDYVIIRAGYGMYDTQADKKFVQNIESAQAAGLPCGVYWYSYAKTVDEAILEAEVCCNTIKDYKFEYPVYYNIEDPLYADLTVEEISAITDAFCSAVESKGYYVAIQTYANFLNSRLDSSVLEKYDVWVAHFGVNKPAYAGKYGMWKYTNSAVIEGISALVNASYCYVDYPSIMKSAKLNGF